MFEQFIKFQQQFISVNVFSYIFVFYLLIAYLIAMRSKGNNFEITRIPIGLKISRHLSIFDD